MKINAELMERIEELEKAGMNGNKIKHILQLDEETHVIKAKYREMQRYYTLREATKELKPYLGKLKNDRAYELKVNRLINSGELKGIKGANNRQSFKIEKTEVKRFIEDNERTGQQWRELVDSKDQRIKELEEEIAKLKETIQSAEKAPEAISEVPDPTIQKEEEVAHINESEASEEVTVSIFKPVAVVKGTSTKKGQKFFWVDEKTKMRYNGILSDEEDQLIDIKQGAALVKDEELLNEMKEAVKEIISTKMNK